MSEEETEMTNAALKMMYAALGKGPQHGKRSWEFILEPEDCYMCAGTGIGYSHEPRSCGVCGGRGYLLKENHDEQDRNSRD